MIERVFIEKDGINGGCLAGVSVRLDGIGKGISSILRLDPSIQT